MPAARFRDDEAGAIEFTARSATLSIMDQPQTVSMPSTAGMWRLADEEFLAKLEWERDESVSAGLRQAARRGNVAEFTRRLQRQLRSVQRRAARFAGGAGAPAASSVLWSRPAFDETPRSSLLADVRGRLIPAADQPPSRSNGRRNGSGGNSAQRAANESALPDRVLKVLESALDEIAAGATPAPFETLQWSELLREFGARVPPALCFRIWRMLATAAMKSGSRNGAAAAASGENGAGSAAADRELVCQGELPFVLGLHLGGLRVATRLQSAGRRALQRALLEQTDANGMPQADLLERLSFWTASLVRARDAAAGYRATPWNDDAEARFRLLVRAAAMLCRSDGRLALSNGYVSNSAEMLARGSRLAGATRNSAPLALLLALQERSAAASRRGGRAGARGGLRRRVRRARSEQGRSLKKFPAAQSDFARLACLRSGWSVDADALVVAHHEAMPRLELAALGRPLLSGAWELAVTVDSAPVTFEQEWTCTCWFSDGDADYLELRNGNSDGVRVERQLLLSRIDHFALFAETVTARPGAMIECASRLPLAAGAAVRPDGPTRECRVKTPGAAGRAFPIALPAERIYGAAGTLSADERRLELRQAGIGGLYAPVVIDWHPERRRAYADWRKLTVTQQAHVLPSDTANGCRLRVGEAQWLIFRSLQRAHEGRAVLGHHTMHETVIARFSSEGEVDPIVQVEYGNESADA